MRLLLDSCVFGRARQELEELGYDVVWAGAWDRDPGDEEILAWALAERRVLVTLDKDFGELAVLRGLPHFGILRLVGFSARNHARLCHETVQRYGPDLLARALVTVDSRRVRVRPSEPQSR